MSTKYKYIALACAFAFGSHGAWAGSPFPSVPYYMKSQKINRAKPNMILVLDNSDSMVTKDVAPKSNPKAREARYIVAKRVALKVYNNQKDKFRWGLAFLNAQWESDNQNAAKGTEFENDYPKDKLDTGIMYPNAAKIDRGFKGIGSGQYYYQAPNLPLPSYVPLDFYYYTEGYMAVPIDDNDPEHETKIKRFISSMYHRGGTPITGGLRSVYNYMSNSDYSHVSDTYAYNYYYGASRNPHYALPESGYKPDSKLVMQYRCQKNYVILISDGENGQGCGTYYQDPDNIKNRGYSTTCSWKFAYNRDYRPENFKPMPLDLDGKSWDDKYFPKQNVITHTIGFRTNALSLKKIASQSGGQFVTAEDEQQLEDKLTSILNWSAVDSPDYVRFDKVNFTNPLAVLTGDSANSLVPMVTINPHYWSSYIQFKRLQKGSPSGYQQDGEGEDIVAYPVTNNQTKRTVLATIPNSNGGSALYDISANNIDKLPLSNSLFNLEELYELDSGYSIYEVDANGDIVYEDEAKTKPKYKPGAQRLDVNKWKTAYIPWLTGWEGALYKDNYDPDHPWTYHTSYRERTGNGTATNAADDDMRRHLGDVTHVDLAMMGPSISKKVAAFTDTFSLPKFLVLQSNDGMVRIYNADYTGTEASNRPYEERLAYIPGNAPRNGNATDRENKPTKLLQDLTIRAREDYKQGGLDHEYFMSGSVNYYSTPDLKDATQRQRYFFIGLLGEGAKAAYALNVGGRDDVSGTAIGIDGTKPMSDVPLWDTSTTAFGKASEAQGLGYTISRAVVGVVAASRDNNGKLESDTALQYVTFLPNGYDYSGSPAIYMMDTLGFKYVLDQNTKKMGAVATDGAGRVIEKIDIPAAAGAVLGGVSAVDYDGDDVIDALYVGDSNGNLYRVDLRQRDSGNHYPVTMLFKGDSAHPITAAPSLARVGNSRYVIFGTGRNYLASDMITDDTRESDIAIQAMYSIRDTAANSINETPPQITYADRDKYLAHSKLLAATKSDGSEVRVIKGNNIVPTACQNSGANASNCNYGWYVDLNVDDNNGNPIKTGERVTIKPIVETTGVDSTVFFNTETLSFKFPPDQKELKCVATSTHTTGWVYQMDAATGLTPTKVYAESFKDKKDMYVGMESGGDNNLSYIPARDSSQNLNGDAENSGSLPNPDPENNKKNKQFNICNTIQGAISTSPTEITPIVKLCSTATVRRISWREIPQGYK